MAASLADLTFEFGLSALDAKTSDDLSDTFRPLLARLGGSTHSATIIGGDIYREIGRKGFGRRNEAWVDMYVQNSYAAFDPIWRSVAAVGLNAFWSEHLSNTPKLDKKPDEVMCNAAAHGLTDGYTSLVRMPGGRSVLFAVMGEKLDHSPMSRMALEVGGRLYVEALAQIVEGPLRPAVQGVEELTRREREVLNAKANNLNDTQVGELLGIRRKTVEDHLRNIREKFCAKTTAEAVRIAESAGMTEQVSGNSVKLQK